MTPSTTKPLDTEDDIDPETIQSAADVSFSLALSMVQSWIPAAASSASVEPSIVESRKKMEEYMRRPPRLGVGAPLPSSTTPNQLNSTHHETQRLKNRLVGSGAVRRRAEDAKQHEASSTRRHNPGSDDEDESESRANVVKKYATRQLNGKPNGLSVFGMTPAGVPKPPQPPPAISSPPPSSTVRSSTPGAREGSPGKHSSPPERLHEPMGVHNLPHKLPLSSKVWARSGSGGTDSPTPSSGPDRESTKRRKVAPMLPPPVNVHTQHPITSRSPSASASSTPTGDSRLVEEREQAEPGSGSIPQLSRKQRKRLRREAAQQSVSQGEHTFWMPSEVETPSLLDQDRGARSFTVLQVESGGPDGSDEESEGTSQVHGGEANEKASDGNDTVQREKNKRKRRRAKKKTGSG